MIRRNLYLVDIDLRLVDNQHVEDNRLHFHFCNLFVSKFCPSYFHMLRCMGTMFLYNPDQLVLYYYLNVNYMK